VSKAELQAAFAEGWSIESIEPVRVEARPDFKDMTFSEGGPKAPYLNPPAFDPVQMGAAIADGFKNARRLYQNTADVLGGWGEWTLADREANYQHYVLDPIIALRKANRAVEQGALPRPVDGLPKEFRRELAEMRNTWAFGGELFPPEEMLRLFTPTGAVGGAKLGRVKAENAHLVAWGFMTRVDGCADEADVLWFGQSRGPKPPSEGRPALEKLNSVFANSVGGFKDAGADDLFVMLRVEQSVAIARYPQRAAPATPAPADTMRLLPSFGPPDGNRARREAWEGDDWDALEPMVRRLLMNMVGKDKADLRELCPVVWGKDYADVSESARETATSKANRFLLKRGGPHTLHKVSGEPFLCWQ
jgi:hypothetical protein